VAARDPIKPIDPMEAFYKVLRKGIKDSLLLLEKTPPTAGEQDSDYTKRPVIFKNLQYNQDAEFLQQHPYKLCFCFKDAAQPQTNIVLPICEVVKISQNLNAHEDKENIPIIEWNSCQFFLAETLGTILGYDYECFVSQKDVENILSGQADPKILGKYLRHRQDRYPDLSL
jgi:hypothetical protein